MRESVAYFGELFGPFQFSQLRLAEIPAYHDFARSMPSTIAFAPKIGFITEAPGEDGIDLPYYVVAHEVAHQWWGQRMMAANTQGAALLSETFAQYSALLMMEKKYGPAQIRRFLKAELDNYLSSHDGGQGEEPPLYRVEDQDAIYYRKGAVVMYALKDYLGEEVVNRSLRRLMELRGWSAQPYASARDFLGIFKEEAGPENSGLIEDFLERITLFDLEVTAARAEPIDDGSYRVRIDLEARKFYADGDGQESEAQFDLPVDIGFFLRSPDSPEFSADDVLLLEKHNLATGGSSLEFELTRKPAYVGIDPYNKLIDRDSNDNLRRVE
jgi:aminopeptidase N